MRNLAAKQRFSSVSYQLAHALRRVGQISLLALVGFGAACGGPEMPDASAEASPGQDVGFVEILATDGLVNARAVFARFREMDSTTAESLLGLDSAGWPASLATDTCQDQAFEAQERSDLMSAAAEIELLEVGDVGIHAAGANTALEPQPLVLPFAAGVIYSAELPWAPSEGHRLTIDGWQLGVESPEPVEFAGELAPAATARPELSRGRDLIVRWVPGEPTTSNVVGIEISWIRMGRTHAVHCRAADDGVFAIPAAWLEGADRAATSPTLRIERVRHAERDGIRLRFASIAARAVRTVETVQKFTP